MMYSMTKIKIDPTHSHILKSLRNEYKRNKRKPTHEPINQSSE